MIEETVTYSVDGKRLVSTVYRMDQDSRGAGILVFPDILGLGEHAHERARRLAELGYVVLAMDLHGDGQVFDAPKALAELEIFYADPSITLRRAEASLAMLCQQPGVDAGRIGAVGFCYGGTLALEMVRSGLPIHALVGFHSVLRSSLSWDRAHLSGRKILVCVGAEDPQIPEEQRRDFVGEMRQTEADWQLHLYGGVYHSFTDRRIDAAGMPDFARYDAAADRRSWRAMKDHFEDAFS
ncbi:MAG TPA: dienelactone hydrolase family protein [Sphingobium sp.]|nr:dienelactone hydrolase family protein [Allosphingosinicella sp.]HKT77592.1 dienelactone hydrolase family protein [Sphingobium sp.]